MQFRKFFIFVIMTFVLLLFSSFASATSIKSVSGNYVLNYVTPDLGIKSSSGDYKLDLTLGQPAAEKIYSADSDHILWLGYQYTSAATFKAKIVFTGRIVNNTGYPMVGADVKGTIDDQPVFTGTDLDGKFTVSVPGAAEIVAVDFKANITQAGQEIFGYYKCSQYNLTEQECSG